jgi:hypothetical protein
MKLNSQINLIVKGKNNIFFKKQGKKNPESTLVYPLNSWLET